MPGPVLSTLRVTNKSPAALSLEIKNMKSFIVQPLDSFSTYHLVHKFYAIPYFEIMKYYILNTARL